VRCKTPHPVLLEIDTAAAVAAGVQFFEGHDRVTLADTVRATYIKIADKPDGCSAESA